MYFQEKNKKLWHTPYYENELKLKQLYIKICKKLPSYGCKIFQVKEILRGNTQKKVNLDIKHIKEDNSPNNADP